MGGFVVGYPKGPMSDPFDSLKNVLVKDAVGSQAKLVIDCPWSSMIGTLADWPYQLPHWVPYLLEKDKDHKILHNFDAVFLLSHQLVCPRTRRTQGPVSNTAAWVPHGASYTGCYS